MSLSFDELAARLGKTRGQLSALVRRGLPCVRDGKRKRFDPVAVRAWLLQEGLAVAEKPPAGAGSAIAVTRHEAAQALGVSLRTFAEWMTDPTFPGKAGPPGRRDGHFPLEEIADWWARKQGAAPTAGIGGESPRERLIRIRAEQEQIELDRLRGHSVDVAAVERLLRRTIATTKAVLLPLADELLQDLPPEFGPAIRERLRERARRRIDEACDTIGDLLAGDDDDTSDED